MTNKEILVMAREAAADMAQAQKVKSELLAGIRDNCERVRAARAAIVLALHKEQSCVDPAIALQAKREAAAQRIINGELDDRLD